MSTQLITNELTFETANELTNQKFKEQNILIEESEKLEAEKNYDRLAKNLDKIADLKLQIWQLIAFQKGWKAGQNNLDLEVENNLKLNQKPE